jgi:periplasmic divalent cation tolerance protein
MIVVLVTAPNDDEAGKISETLVEEKIIACANRLPVRSVYRWREKIEDDSEVLLLCKTKKELLGKLVERVKELHSYEVPEIIALPIIGGSDDYLKWIDESTRSI